ncbi:MAG TPA: hypothetical protein VLA12_00740 [Planctomycetaceae bacterium]|nr:hypothetical protein [Planctomycetaceae bacterium]
MPSALNVPEVARVGRLTHGFFEDFQEFVTGDLWTVTASNSGGVTIGDAAGGIATVDPSGTTIADNDETYLHTTKELFLLAAEKPLDFAARIKFAEAATNAANVAVGLMDAVAANSIQDNGAGPDGTFDGAVIYKVDGGTVWRFKTSNATTATDSISTTTAGGSSYQTLEIRIRHQDAANCSLVPLVDGVQLKTSGGVLIEHKLAYSGLAEMAVVLGLKSGSTTAESLLVDYVSCWQKR